MGKYLTSDPRKLPGESSERQSENGRKQHTDAQTERGNAGGKSPADSISGNFRQYWMEF